MVASMNTRFVLITIARVDMLNDIVYVMHAYAVMAQAGLKRFFKFLITSALVQSSPLN